MKITARKIVSCASGLLLVASTASAATAGLVPAVKLSHVKAERVACTAAQNANRQEIHDWG